MIDGILVLDKPTGWTSTKCVSLVRRLLRTRRVGHAGTLDPLATGVLPVCVGRATRVVEYIHDAAKEYEATIRLGIETDTCDSEGEVVATAEVAASDRTEIDAVLREFTGTIRQQPPLFSAIRVGGVRAYDLARRGSEYELPEREVRIDAIEVVAFDGTVLRLRVACGRGTYIRSLARDIGRRLGCGGHIAALRRTRVGAFRQPVSPEELEAAIQDGRWWGLLLPLSTALQGRPAAVFGDAAARAIARGQLVETAGCVSDASECIAYSLEGDALAVLRRRDGDWWHPGVVFATA